jgi:hypothetical protein
MEVMHPIFFSETITTVTMEFTYILGKLRPLQSSDHFPQRLHYQHNFPPLRETQYAGRVKLFAALDAHCVSVRRRPQNDVLEVYLSGGHKRWKPVDAKSGL